MTDRPGRASPSPQLRKDFGVFFEGGFLVAIGLVLLLGAAAAVVTLLASSRYGIPPLLGLSP